MTRPAWHHETAIVEEGAEVGDGTKVWHFAHVRAGSTVGKDCIIGKGVYVDAGVRLGDRCKVQNSANLYQGLTVGDEVFIGPNVQFTNDLNPRATLWDAGRLVETRVEDGASIGANATVICGITIGSFALVGAGSVVTKDVAPHHIVVGNPARVVGVACWCGNKMAPETDGGHRCPSCGKTLDAAA
ncbi:MAG: acyltransferase [Thermoplasmatota archaeon]